MAHPVAQSQSRLAHAVHGLGPTPVPYHAVQAEVPAQVLYATGQDQYRKPEKGMWDYWLEHGNDGQEPGKLQTNVHDDHAVNTVQAM